DILSGGAISESFSAVFDTTLGGGNVLANPNAYPGFTATANLNSTDPQLGPLKYNGGPTFTMAPRAGSPVIGKGDNTFAPQLLNDQRGPGFDRAASANGSGARIPDMGAVEVQP